MIRHYKDKIKTLPELLDALQFYRNRNQTIALCHGVFDIIHEGHIHHLNEAKKIGDILVVSLTSDKFVNKGPGRPIVDEQNRLAVVAAIEVVDYTVLNDALDPIKLIRFLKPNYYIKGEDTHKTKNEDFNLEIEAVIGVGGEIQYIPSLSIHTIDLIRKGWMQ